MIDVNPDNFKECLLDRGHTFEMVSKRQIGDYVIELTYNCSHCGHELLDYGRLEE